MRIVLQVKPLANFVNPNDRPKNALDLAQKIGKDQGYFAYYRGMNAYIYKQLLQFSIKFGLYETVFQHLKSRSCSDYSLGQSILAATITSIVTTTVTYPLDFAHGRMSADMSKKPSVYVENSEVATKPKGKLYASIRDCLQQAQFERGLSQSSQIQNVFRGYKSALIGQVPYTVVLISTFELLERVNDSANAKFNRRDGLPFLYKLEIRFGPSTFGLLFAQALCYPFDTVKRRMQLNGAKGHKNIYKGDYDCFTKILKDEGAVKGLYAGFSVNLLYNPVGSTDDCSPGNTPISFNEYKPRFSEPIQLNREDSQAIPFIKFIQSEGKFELNPEAGEFLQSLKDIKLGVVAVCGKYRTGKSYLLNKLFVETYFQNLNGTQTFHQAAGNITTAASRSRQGQQATEFSNASQANQQHFSNTMTSALSSSSTNLMSNSPINANPHVKANNGFQVSPTINPCTKGLWIWKKVIYSDQNDCPMIVIDTEGLGAFDEDENHDAKIFLLALLLSSLIIYNSVGTIDENALNNLSLVINLSKKIQLRNRQETPEDIDELASIFPSFLWVLRDFTLKLVDSEGNRISSKQYLENALKEQKGCSEAIEQKNRIRRLLQHFFQERDCCTLIRPTEKEKDLQDLAKLRDSNLRRDFIDQLARLKQKVMTKVKIKVMNGHQLNGPMIVELAMSYISALNQGQVPNIESAWQNVCGFEQERAFKEAVKLFESQVKETINSTFDDIGYGNIKTVLNQIKDNALQFLRGKFLGEPKQFDHFEKKLKDELKKQSKVIIKEVQLKIDDQIIKALQVAYQETIEDKTRRESSDLTNLEQLSQELDHLLTVIQIKFVNDTERVEELFRKFLLKQKHIFRTIDQLNDNERRQEKLKQRLLEERVKLNDTIIENLKQEKKEITEEQRFDKAKFENERAESFRSTKLLEQRVLQYEERLQSALESLKLYKARDYRDQYVQTQKLDADEYIQVLNESDSIEEINQNYQRNLGRETISRSINTSFAQDNKSDLLNKDHRLSQEDNCLNKKFYQDIMQALNKQSQVISTSIGHDLSELVQSNSQLAQALESQEKRYQIIEKKLQKQKKYQELIQHSQRLQCGGCQKLYTPVIFATHYRLCQKSEVKMSRNAFRGSDSQSNFVCEQNKTEKNNSNTNEQDEQLSIKVLDIFIQTLENSNSRIQNSQAQEFTNSDELVTIMDCQTLARQQLDHALQGLHINSNNPSVQSHISEGNSKSSHSVHVKFSIKYRGNHKVVNKTLISVKQLMNCVQRDSSNNENEQYQIAKWLLDIERLETQQSYSAISYIIDQFNLQITLKITTMKIESQERNNKFEELLLTFYETGSNFMNNQAKHNHNDDEVVVQMTYEDHEHPIDNDEYNYDIYDRGTSSVAKTIPSNISELCSGGENRLGIQRIQGFGMTGSAQCQNHSTIQLDGEKSLNDNNSLHFVSFFSVAEELLMKKNLLEGYPRQGQDRGSHFSHSRSTHQLHNYDIDHDEYATNDFAFQNCYQNINTKGHRLTKISPFKKQNENRIPEGSPQKIMLRRDLLEHQPFSLISNQQTAINHIQTKNFPEERYQQSSDKNGYNFKVDKQKQANQEVNSLSNNNYYDIHKKLNEKSLQKIETQSPYNYAKAGMHRQNNNKSCSSLNKSAQKSQGISVSKSIHHMNCIPHNDYSKNNQSITSLKSRSSLTQSASKIFKQPQKYQSNSQNPYVE